MLKFSASHTDGLVMCAVAAGRDVGADVEYLSETPPLEIADRFFSPAETEAIRALDGAERVNSFFTYWTLKESYMKARGLGLSLPTNKFSFQLAVGASPRIMIDPAADDHAEGWNFFTFRPTPFHCAAVCVLDLEKPKVSIVTVWDQMSG